MIGMLRPVGSRVPVPGPEAERRLPWVENYHTWFMGSGTEALSAAILLAIRSAGPKSSSPEVILPAYGCPDLVAAAVAQGVRPVLVDLQADCPFMDIEKVDQAFSNSTVAVIAAGFLGVPERLSSLAPLCEERGAWLIEDSAQCFPPECAREPIADCAVLSFGRGKPINLMGGGALLVRSDHSDVANEVLSGLPEEFVEIDLKWRIRRLIFNFLLGRFSYGLLKRVPFLGLGATVYKPLGSLCRIQMPNGLLEAGIQGAEERPAIAARYWRELDFLCERGWKCFMQNGDSGGAMAGRLTLRYGLLAPDKETRDKAIEALNFEGIGANVFYGRPLPDIQGVPCLLSASTVDFPNADSFADRLMTLPSHEDVTDRDVSIVAAVLDKFAAEQKE